jgi:hypothetical protein
VVTSGSNATSVQKVNGGAVPGNATALSSNSSSQIVAATLQGNGAKVQLSTGSTTTNDCVKFDANGNTVDAGAACGSGNSSGLFNVSATTTVVTIPAAQYRNNNAITNISTIGTITAGSGSLATGAQIWCYWNPASPSVPICDYNSNVTSSGLTFSNASLGNGSASSYPDCVVPIATITGGTPANEWIAVTNAPFAVSTQCEQAGTNMTKSVGSNGVTTWSSTASGGSSLFSNSQGYQAATNLTGVGNDIAIFTTPSIASLPGTVNSCVAVHTLITDVSGATGLTMKLRADYVSSASPGTLIATLKSSWGSSGESDILNFDYCNDAGSQTAQHIDDTYSSYVTSGTINLQINSMGLSAAATNALTWSSAHTLSITVSGATCTGCVQGIEFSADQK